MIVFTLIGLLFFWSFCWGIGYHVAMAMDAKACMDKLMAPVESEIAVLIRMLSAFNTKGPA